MITSKTQHGRMLISMSRSPNKRWRAEQFMDKGLGELFVGYEANTRMSDLLRFGFVERKYCKDVDPTYRGNVLRKCYKINTKGLQLVKSLVPF